MNSIIMRSGLIAWGQNPPSELHSIVSDGYNRRIVTWKDVMDKRREDQNKRLNAIRHIPEWRAHRLSVAYFGNGLMGGWNAFIDDISGRSRGTWIDRDLRWLTPKLLEVFPLEARDWSQWKIEFAQRFERGRQYGEPRAVVNVWWNRRDAPLLESLNHG